MIYLFLLKMLKSFFATIQDFDSFIVEPSSRASSRCPLTSDEAL
jgi:hypothetical protein